MFSSIGQGRQIACNLTCYKHDNCINSQISVYLYVFLAFSIVKIRFGRGNGDEIQASIQPGKLFLFSNILFIYLFCCDCHDHRDCAVSIQPRIRLTLYNSNQCKFLNCIIT